MIRVALFLIFVAVVALGFVWLADRPGDVAVTWQGQQHETSVMVAAVALVALMAAAIAVWSLVRFVWRSPARAAAALTERRRRRGQDRKSVV
jgi:HemY protein